MSPVGFFGPRPQGPPFGLFGRAHLAALAGTGAGLAALIIGGRRLDADGRRWVKLGIVGLLHGQEVVYHGWKVRQGTWSVAEMLPLHVCSTLVWGGGVALLHPTRFSDDIAYYWGLGATPQALMTPDLGEYGPQHFRFYQFFLSHGLIMAIPLWRVLVEGQRPVGVGRAFGALVAQAAVAHLVNRRLGGNYMFVSHKPATASLLDRLPPWPGYVLVGLGLGGIIFAGLRGVIALLPQGR